MTETYFDGENELTVVHISKKIFYYLGDKFHRKDGPAVIEYDVNRDIKRVEYWVNGTEIDIEHSPGIDFNN